MKRKEFIRIVTGAMEMIENEEERYSCNALSRLQKHESVTVKRDYAQVFGIEYSSYYDIPIGFGITSNNEKKRKQARLNALAMYLAQSLAFKTYKDL